jgi:hypothetical protein
MKNYIQENYKEKLSYDKLRIAVKEAWEVVEEDKLTELLLSMHVRCEAVITTNSIYIKF